MPIISGLTPIGAGQNSWKRGSGALTAATLGGTPVIQGDQYGSIVLLMNGGETLAVKAVPTQSGSTTVGCSIDWSVDNVAQDLSLQYATANTEQTIIITIPGSGLRRVELFEQRCYITALTPQTTATVVLPTTLNSLWLPGASGTEGYYSWNPSHFDPSRQALIFSWTGRVKTSGLWDAVYVTAFDGYGLSDHLGTFTPTTGIMNAWLTSNGVPRVTGTNSQGIVNEFGAGDYLHQTWTAAQIQNYYGMLADCEHAMFPGATIFFKTPIIINSSPFVEGYVNAAGATIQAVRNAIIAMAATRPWIVLIHGYLGGVGGETQNTGQLQDGLHATPVAHRDSIFPYDYAILSAYLTPIVPPTPYVPPTRILIPLPGGALLDVTDDPSVVSADEGRVTLHTPLARNRVLEFWKNKPNLLGILASYTDELQLLENAIWDTITKRYLSWAQDAQLDTLGAIVGQPRNGLTDPAYRARIQVRIRINRSFGTAVDLIEVLRMLDPSSVFKLTDYGTAAFSIEYTTLPVISVAVQVPEIITEARAAGVGATVTLPSYTIARRLRLGTTRDTAVNQHVGFGTAYEPAIAQVTGGLFAHIQRT